jgi:hypothetical protein
MTNSSLYAAFERMWQHITILVGRKVDKVDGKGLSSNDFTNEEKSKLNSSTSIQLVSWDDSDF